MTPTHPIYFSDLDQCVDALIDKVGKKVVIAGGFGRPIHIFNALYRRAVADPDIQLTIITGVSFSRPRGSSDLEKRFLEPFVDRVFGNLPELEYVEPYQRGKLPKNIEIVEVFLQAGTYLGNKHAQQNFVYSNFTHWLRDMIEQGCNVFGQMIARREIDGEPAYSMSQDAYALDILPRIQALREEGKQIAVVGQVNDELPFMYNDAIVPVDTYDFILDDPRFNHTLLGPPSTAVDITDYMIGLNASSLIPDGGTLQIGIGALGDAIAYACILRHERNQLYRDVLAESGLTDRFGEIIDRVGETGEFQQGIYGSTEMFADGFRHLINHGVLKRAVYDHVGLQRLVNEGRLAEGVTAQTLPLLVQEQLVSPRLTPEDVRFLIKYGIFQDRVVLADGVLCCGDGIEIEADLGNVAALEQINRHCLGQQLRGGMVLHAGFFLGPQAMYRQLREMPEEESRRICMTDIAYVNQLYGHEEIARLQRQKARFINTAIMVSLLGDACSDGLEDGRKISGVGGQYNFVAMAHALADGRSVLMCRSTRSKGGETTSNIVWNYGHTTIPAHLRDIVVTEYGVAMLRGQREKDVIARMLNIADSRFQPQLLEQAKSAGKIPDDYEIPAQYRNNTPERLERIVARLQPEGFFPAYPFGSDFTPEEKVLADVLQSLKAKMGSRRHLFKTLAGAVAASGEYPESAQPYLARMGLEQPEDFKHVAIQKLILAELHELGHI
ncbi:MAG: acetyl-CoA hydrolase [Halioglobus sp.]|nr:acetyl-CoA hydrolase [Halioglobus sp.]